MRTVTALLTLSISLAFASIATAQSTEYIFDPERTGNLDDPFPVYEHNGARGLSGPWDMDKDGLLEVLVAQHDAAGGRVFVIENTGTNTWEVVYATAFLDSTSSSSNARYATAGDLDGDGDWEIIVVMGDDYSGAVPAYTHGVYVWEHDGVVGSDNYGNAPATVGDFFALDGQPVQAARAQNLEVVDVDGDGEMELLAAMDGGNAADIMYVLSVDGTFEPEGAGTGFEVWEIEARAAPRVDGFGGGSPYDMIAADLNGDGALEISFHTWQNLNFFNVAVTGEDTYVFPDTMGGGGYYYASPTDDVALFGGIAYDMDGDGNDEIFYPNLMSGNLTVFDYDDGDDIFQVDDTKIFFDAIEIGGAGGIAIGDLDGDGRMEILTGGPGYTAAQYNAGEPSTFITIAEYTGGSPHDGANYDIEAITTGSPADTAGFHTVYRDSAGVMTKYFETARSKQGITDFLNDPVFTSGIAFMGDADGDGSVEIALSFQGVDDSLFVIDEVWDDSDPDSLHYDRTIRETVAAPIRAFLRIISLDGLVVSVEDNVIITPDDYILDQNYPNPFSGETTIEFELPLDKRVSVRVYDITGRLVKTLVDDEQYFKGRHTVRWDGTTVNGAEVASGTYIYALEYGNFRKSRQMVVVK